MLFVDHASLCFQTQTYGYVAGGLGMTAAFATHIARSPHLYYRIATVNPMVMLVGTLAGTIGMSQIRLQSWWGL
jgi:hypothetical protein